MDEEFKQKQNELDREIDRLEARKLYILTKLKSVRQQKEQLRLDYSLAKIRNRPDASYWTREKYPWAERVHEVLREKFQLESFRPNQLAAINATLCNRDVLLIMPTGGGKSLVYQLPAVLKANLTVVISPLLSLIEDQLMALRKIGISSATLNSNMTKESKKAVNVNMLAAKINIIFVTPECIAKSKTFLNNLTKMHKEGFLGRFVIDEIHCCSQWGHDFRTDYTSLSLLKRQFPGVPILGLTATATPSVLVDIQKILDIDDSVIITAPYNRPNLFYKIVPKPETKKACIDYLYNLLTNRYCNQSGIIYAGTQNDCDDLASELKEKSIKVAPYHANVPGEARQKIHKRWSENHYQVVVATIAFGMGIDKPDVRFVIHYTVPKSIEGLYQESGRAGRDGKPADCILLYNLNDWLKISANTQNKREEDSTISMLKYCINGDECRRKLISKYFDDDWRASDCNEMCDRCRTPQDVTIYNLMPPFATITEIIERASSLNINLTLKKLLDAWFHAGPKNIYPNDPIPKFSRLIAENIVAILLTENILVVRRGYTMMTNLAYIDRISDEPFNVDELQEKVVMKYCGYVKGLEVLSPIIPPRSIIVNEGASYSGSLERSNLPHTSPASTSMDAACCSSSTREECEPSNGVSRESREDKDVAECSSKKRKKSSGSEKKNSEKKSSRKSEKKSSGKSEKKSPGKSEKEKTL